MRGVVVHVENRIGWIAIRDEGGEITLAELIGGYDVEKGNVISGNLHSLGTESFYNHSTDEALDVFVQEIHASDQQALNLIRSCR